MEEAVLTVPRLVISGFCFAVGFYLAKKVTNKIDEKLITWNDKKMQELMNEI